MVIRGPPDFKRTTSPFWNSANHRLLLELQMPHRAAFDPSNLTIVERATHEPVILGDFVRLASGSPLGLVIACDTDVATVAWLTDAGLRSSLPAVCLRPLP